MHASWNLRQHGVQALEWSYAIEDATSQAMPRDQGTATTKHCHSNDKSSPPEPCAHGSKLAESGASAAAKIF
eukprot:CAMPEP_0181446576 /NCGR_PEP_ID=MMETSP1110-20121109/26176_1 /TAXON_ID=174948 /ORGANISM="Symbiodinium sp., Strain CCMP421" /LENGTH=71 /DNA_ID=CAMNT_0023570659 /DNA_START=1056 /DNA_END=1271 /DNA_ORIENTATION=-